MSQRITIDPITRIEGHLRIDVQIDGGAISDAWVSATMWREMETILRGRDAREAWLFAQRICGVCTTVHAIASVRAVEDALKLEIPLNAQYIRNLILIHHALRDHAGHFYQLSSLDWLDPMRAAKADPRRAFLLAESRSSWARNSRDGMQSSRDKMAHMIENGRLGIFADGYGGHPGMHLDPEACLVLLTHYLDSFEFLRKSSQVVAMLGGKTPHIQNLTVGGVANAINLDSEAALGLDRLEAMRATMAEVVSFIHQVYFEDACLLAGSYPEWFDCGKGSDFYVSVPDLPRGSRGQTDMPGGSLQRVVKPYSDAEFREAITEDNVHAYYRGNKALHPWKGETEPDLTDWDPEKKYSWVKAARYHGQPAEVGPLADVLIGYAQGHALTRKWTNLALERVSATAGCSLTVENLRSTMGRHVARAIRAAMLAELAERHWELLVNNIAGGDLAVHNVPQFPSGEVSGLGIHSAPRGALSHWVVVDNGIIKNYQAVVPSTWNASPRDRDGVPGPYEAALRGITVADVERPLEVLRTVHSFDPCMACACHAFDAAGKQISVIKVL